MSCDGSDSESDDGSDSESDNDGDSYVNVSSVRTTIINSCVTQYI